jgi:hypothetical protein
VSRDNWDTWCRRAQVDVLVLNGTLYVRCVVTLLRIWCSFNGPSDIGHPDARKVVHGETRISTELPSSDCYIPRAHSLSNVYDMVGVNRSPKTHVLKRDRTTCSKIVHDSKRNSQFD